jgi:uncharacterized protein (DUF1778 family)
MITSAQFEKWLIELSFLDRMNFQTLIGLPGARKLIEKMADGQYKDMATFILDEAAQKIKDILEI